MSRDSGLGFTRGGVLGAGRGGHPGRPLLSAPGTMAVNFPVADGGSFMIFAADHLAGEFLPGHTRTVTATFSDGSTATAVTTVP